MTIRPADLSHSSTGMATAPEQSPAVLVVLTERDIPGAFLDVHRLETYTILCPVMVAVMSWNLSTYLTEESPSNIEMSK